VKLNFRQGLVRYQTDIANNPVFLQKHSLSGDYIDLMVQPDPTIINFAHGDVDYLIEENKTVIKAWGPVSPIGQTQYLYWDINLLDGSLSRNFTLLPLLVTASTPNSPAIDQHWFDLNTKQMKVWNGTKWVVKLRVFAAIYDSSAILNPFSVGSQVGLNNTPCDPGYIVFGKDNKPLRHSDGTFFTTSEHAIVGRNSSSSVSFDAQIVYAMANEYIPKYSLVSFTGPDKISLASHLNVDKQVNGIVLEDLYLDEIGRVITHGRITNEHWSWTASNIGKPLFCGPSGEVTLTPPPMGISQQIGIVQDYDTIYLNLMSPIIL
jgi:hypothetical protein